MLEKKEWYLKKIQTDMNGADMMTKELPREKLEVCREVTELILVGSSL